MALPLIHRQIVEMHGWLTVTEFADIITIAEMTPGPIAINAATFVGIRVAGLPGAIVSTLACVLPSFVIVLLLAKIYYRYRNLNTMQYILSGLRPAVVAMIASAGLGIMLLAFFVSGRFSLYSQGHESGFTGDFMSGMFVLRKWKLNPLFVMGSAGVIGLAAVSVAGDIEASSPSAEAGHCAGIDSSHFDPVSRHPMASRHGRACQQPVHLPGQALLRHRAGLPHPYNCQQGSSIVH